MFKYSVLLLIAIVFTVGCTTTKDNDGLDTPQHNFPTANTNETQPNTEQGGIVADEKDYLLEMTVFTLMVPGTSSEDSFLIVDKSDNGTSGRIQNYKPVSDVYTLQKGEFYVEFFENAIDETQFRKDHPQTSTQTLAGKEVLYAEDGPHGGESASLIHSYYVQFDTQTLLITVSSESDEGIEAGKKILQFIEWKK